MTARSKNWATRHSEVFKEFLLGRLKIDNETRSVKADRVYCSLVVNIQFKGKTIAVPLSHVVWFLKYKQWPKEGYHLDHINDDPLDNRVENLQEITAEANHYKRRGRGNNQYGSTKYGHGIYIGQDKRDGRFYIARTFSRGQTKTKEKISVKISIGGADTLEEAEQIVTEYVKTLDDNYDLSKDILGYIDASIR